MVCSKCGTKNEDDSKFCQYCGTQLEFIPDNIEESNIIDTQEQLLDNNSKNNKSNKKTIIIIVLIVVLVSILAVYFLYNKDDKNNGNETSNKEPDSNEVSNIESNVTSNIDSNITSNQISNVTSNQISNVTSNSNSNTVAYGGYIIYVPPTYTVSSTETTLQLIGKNDRDFAVITIEEASYSAIKASPKIIQDHVQKRQMVCNNIRTSIYNGVEFTTAEINNNGMNMILGYAEIDNTHVLGIMVANVSYTIDYTQFNTFANVIKTIKKA